jgi:hypothetical protein
MFYREKAQYCPGEVCDVKAKQDIQKTSAAQLFIILGFIAYIWLAAVLFNSQFSKTPFFLFGADKTAKAK